MPSTEDYHGYREDFLGDGSFRIPLAPIVENSNYEPVELTDEDGEFILNYKNYSVIMDSHRKFPILTATNINGKRFKTAERKDSWKKDNRIDPHFQWGSDLYKAERSDFDKGHMTKREDVQWGPSEAEAKAAAESTFYYTNAIPQHHRLNRAAWRSIEDYILKSETVKNDLNVTVLTGPVLDSDDPEFVTEVKGQIVKLPALFWKIVYYFSDQGELCRTAFLVSQKELLEKWGIVKRTGIVRSAKDSKGEPYFLRFKKAATYQVRVDLVEDLTGLNFAEAVEKYEDERPRKLIEKAVNVRNHSTGEAKTELNIRNLVV